MASGRDPITAVSLGIAPLLAGYFDPRKWGAPKVVGLPFTSTHMARLTDKTPALHIGFDGFAFGAPGAARIFGGAASFALVIVCRAAGAAPEAAQLGDKLGPGLYPSLITAAYALHGRIVDDVGTLRVTRLAQAGAEGWLDKGIAAGIVSFEVSTGLRDFLGEAESAPDFTRLVSDFEVNLPADAGPDAVPAIEMGGDITLPGGTP